MSATGARDSSSSVEPLKGEVSSIEAFSGRLPQMCTPVRMEGVTLQCIGRVSENQNNDKGKGQSKGLGEKGKKGRKEKKDKDNMKMAYSLAQRIYDGLVGAGEGRSRNH